MPNVSGIHSIRPVRGRELGDAGWHSARSPEIPSQGGQRGEEERNVTKKFGGLFSGQRGFSLTSFHFHSWLIMSNLGGWNKSLCNWQQMPMATDVDLRQVENRTGAEAWGFHDAATRTVRDSGSECEMCESVQRYPTAQQQRVEPRDDKDLVEVYSRKLLVESCTFLLNLMVDHFSSSCFKCLTFYSSLTFVQNGLIAN